MTITLQFIGAARFVTGSKHLLTVNGKNVLLDCGMVQGPRKIANKANQLGLKKAQDVLQEMGRQNVAGRWAGS